MIYDKNSPETIEKLFSTIAPRYDLANAFASFGCHKWWNRQLIRAILKHKKPTVHLDLCCGTGAIGIPLAKKAKIKRIHLLDFSKGMLEVALHKALKTGLRPEQIDLHLADATKIPLPSASVDSVSIAYGIRNVKDPLKLLQEVSRVLKPGGIFVILDLTMPKNRLLARLHKLYLNRWLPALAGFLTGEPEAYQYLSSSIQAFRESFLELLLQETDLVTRKGLKRHLGGVAFQLIAEKPMTSH